MKDPYRHVDTFVVGSETLRLVWSQLGDGPSVLFLHGMGSSRLAFIDLMESRPVAGTFYAVDLPGFGESSFPKDKQTIAHYVEVITTWMVRRNVTPVIMGHSFGGMIAAELAIAQPHMCSGLILVATAGFFPPVHALKPLPYPWVNQILLWLTSTNWYGNQMLRTLGVDPQTVPAHTRARMRFGWRHAREMIRMGEFYRVPYLAERLSASRVPAIFIHGDNDRLFPLAALQKAIGAMFPLMVQPGAGHLPYDYSLAQFNRLFIKAYQRIYR